MQHLRSIARLLVAALAVTGLTLGATALAQDYDAWLRQVQMGPYQNADEDWDAILEAARSEPPLVLYTETSRAFPMVEAFEAETGLSVEGINLRGTEIIERIRREFDAGIYNVGVVLVGSGALIQDQLMSRNALTAYTPSELIPLMSESAMSPLMVHRYSVGTWYYKNEADPNTPPYENIWAFTTPEFSNRVAINSPLVSGTTMEYMVGLVSNADLMAELYEDYFGEPIRLAVTENAGYEFIKRLLENRARVLPAFRDVSAAVSAGQGFFVGFGAHSAYAAVVRGEFDFQLDTDVAPAVLSPRYIGIGTYTESPNTAKLLLRWLTSQDGGSVWWGEDFPGNPTVMPTGEMETLRLDSFDKLWDTPIEQQLQLRDDIADFFILYQ
jgi:iron(III) transport system substrate-binding protein